VVVIGYGSQKKREVTGAVSVVDSKTLEILKPIKIEQALQGTVAGVNVTTTSGAPGAALDIRIRGIATNGDNRPLTIIDGYQGELGLLNPNDVETITVLKDAQAAIYGSIGANGVILITTKTGKKNAKGKIAYNTYTGFQETTRKLPVLNATQYALLLNESYANGGKALPFPDVSGLGKGTDWQDEVFSKSVPVYSHDLSFSGGSDKMTYAVSGSHLDQEGIIGGAKSGFLRNTARVSLGADVSDRLKLKTNVIYTYFKRRTLLENAIGSVLFNAINLPSTLAPYDANGDFTIIPSPTGLGNELINPLAQIANTYNNYNFKKISGTFGLDYKLFKGFVVTSTIGFNSANSESKSFSPLISYGPNKVFNNTRSSVSQSAINDNDYSFDIYGTYTKKVAENHNFVGTIGSTVFKEYGNGLFATGFDVPYNSWEFADVGLARGTTLLPNPPSGSYVYDERRISYFGRLQYDFKGKYLFSALARRDLSTKFGPENRVAFFPSLTAGWVISDESFFGESKTVNFLKFRASYGTLGNDRIGNNRYISQLNLAPAGIFGDNQLNGVSLGVIPNPDIKWETAKKFDVGFDVNLFDNKVTVTTDYFIDTRADLLINSIPVSGILGTAGPGAGSPTINAGTVRNSGTEISVEYKNKFSDNFSMSVGYNVTFIKNEVLEVNGVPYIEGGQFGSSVSPSRMSVGNPIGYFYGLQTNGLYQNQADVDVQPVQNGVPASIGDIRYVDQNGDGLISLEKDRVSLGDPIPDATMGFNLQFNYKALDFSMYTFASVGNEIVRNYERPFSDVNHLDYFLGRWTGEGTSNSTPKVTTGNTSNNLFSDYYVEDGSYLRIQNIQLGYTLNSKFAEKSGISKLRIYTAVNNLYTFTKYQGFDPGASNGQPIGGGIDGGFYPISRTYMLGLNINF
jgi:TonB-linked SusC/RagA family outer membrane protein